MAVRLVVKIALANGWNLWTRDVKQAYLQGGKLSRYMYARLPKELKAQMRGYVFKTLAPVYGVKEACFYWSHKYLEMHYSKMKMKSTIMDKFLLYRLKNTRLDVNEKGKVVNRELDDTDKK